MNKKLKLKKGDIVTYKSIHGGNALIMGVNAYEGDTIEQFEGDNAKVLKVERPVKYETIYELKEILDDVEKKWLGYFIKPFRNKIKNITKCEVFNKSYEYLVLNFKNEPSVALPYFKPNTMYKGMKINKKYTLEELGL